MLYDCNGGLIWSYRELKPGQLFREVANWSKGSKVFESLQWHHWLWTALGRRRHLWEAAPFSQDNSQGGSHSQAVGHETRPRGSRCPSPEGDPDSPAHCALEDVWKFPASVVNLWVTPCSYQLLLSISGGVTVRDIEEGCIYGLSVFLFLSGYHAYSFPPDCLKFHFVSY